MINVIGASLRWPSAGITDCRTWYLFPLVSDETWWYLMPGVCRKERTLLAVLSIKGQYIQEESIKLTQGLSKDRWINWICVILCRKSLSVNASRQPTQQAYERRTISAASVHLLQIIPSLPQSFVVRSACYTWDRKHNLCIIVINLNLFIRCFYPNKWETETEGSVSSRNDADESPMMIALCPLWDLKQPTSNYQQRVQRWPIKL